jgi:ribosomal protein S18 acetylase RimI-like enzyme
MIKLVKLTEFNHLMSALLSAIKNMEQEGINQWDQVYPSKETMIADINSNTLHGFYDLNTLCGFVALNNDQPQEYHTINWQCVDDNPLVVHRLCVDPKYQGQGIAKKLIKFTEEYAAENNYQSIRLDAFCDNPVSCAMYRKLGYVERGIVIFRKGRFYCFEKVVSNKNIDSSEEYVCHRRKG